MNTSMNEAKEIAAMVIGNPSKYTFSFSKTEPVLKGDLVSLVKLSL